MKIQKYKYLKEGKYEVIIDNINYIIYEDIIIKNNLLSKKEISEKELNNLLKDNSFYDAYFKSIKYINLKLRTRKEIEIYLKKDFDKNIIDDVITKLENEKYLNDDTYSKAYIHDNIVLKMIGPKKIEADLIKNGINKDIVKNNLKVFTKDIELEKLNKLITKLVNSNNNKSSYILKNKILNDMINKGFTKSYILEMLESIDINDTDAYKKEYEKQKKKLSKKYSGNELEYKIKQNLYSKGFKVN